MRPPRSALSTLHRRGGIAAFALASVAALSAMASAEPHATPTPAAATGIDCDKFESQVELRSLATANAARPTSPAPIVVPTKVAASNRISGTAVIRPPESAMATMASTGRHRAIAAVKICISTGGRITQEQLLKRSGLPAWDRRLCEAIRAWRYRPFEVNGQPVPVCTSVVFIYHQTDADDPGPPTADQRRAASRALLQALAAGDARAFAAHVRVPFGVEHMWFDTKACRTEFSGMKRVTAARLPALVRCLRRIGVHEDDAGDQLPRNLVAWTNEPGSMILGDLTRTSGGVVLAALHGDAYLYGDDNAAAPVDSSALERHRTVGTRLIEPDATGQTEAAHADNHHAVVYYTVCVGRTGRVASVELTGGPPAYRRTVETAIRGWRFRPFRVHAGPVAVCSSFAAWYPRDGYVPPPPPPPSDMAGPDDGKEPGATTTPTRP